MKLSLKIILLIICCYSIISCSDDDDSEQIDIPYSASPNTVFEAPGTDRFYIVNEEMLEQAEYVSNFTFTGIPAPFTEVVQLGDDSFLVLISQEDKLLFYMKGETVQEVAEYGEGPNDIQHGIRLIKMPEQILLVQANRVSGVSYEDPISGPNVLFNSDTFINSAGNLRDGRFVVDSFDGSADPSLKVLGTSFEILESHGEFFNHPDPSVLRNFSNYSFTQTADGEILLRFGAFEFGGIYDDELNLIQKIHIKDMFTPDAGNLTEENITDTSVPQSRMFAYQGAASDELWVAVNHNVLREGESGMYSDQYEHFFDYYTLSLENGLEYAGSSQYSIFPAGDTMFISGEEHLYYLPYDLIIDADDREPFQIPDSFNL